MQRRLTLALLVTGLLGHSIPSAAQSALPFPSKPITLVVPFTPGSGSDTIARIIGPKLAAKWGQPVVVDNKPGASGNLGTLQAARAQPDGHTLLMAINTHAMTSAVYKNLPYDPVQDLAPVTKLAEASFALVVAPGLLVQDMRSLIAYAKANPGRLNYSSPGNGTPHHLAMELLKSTYGVFMVHVPYRGIAGAITDLMGEQVQLMFASVPSIRTQVQAGRLKAVAVTGEGRSGLLPEVPTFREQGFAALDVVDAWYAVLAPARTAPALVDRLNRDFTDVMNSAEVKHELARLGLTVRTGTPAQLATLIQSDMARWQKVVTTAHITAD